MLKQLRNPVPLPDVEQRAALLAGKNISYTLKRSSKRRSIGLRIDDNGLTVSVPLRASESWLHSVLQDKAHWVVQKLDGWQSRQRPVIQWAHGERIPFRGEEFVLQLTPRARGAVPQLHGETLHVPVGADAEAARIEKAVTLWYRKEAMRVFGECVAYFAPLMNVAPREIKLTSATTQWGSCTVHGVVRLNWQLVKMQLHLIDYVVVHELAHLVEMNHSPAFWSVVERVCPDYKQHRAELRSYGVAE
ncbi:MAG: M48 family metallopeptidase [Nitrosomonadales bacterium]|nr:M48 family metallopeptidase [Nitrosomonadales bacterium]